MFRFCFGRAKGKTSMLRIDIESISEFNSMEYLFLYPRSLPAVSDVSKSCTPANEDFKVKVLEAFDEVDNVLLFVQDTVSYFSPSTFE